MALKVHIPLKYKFLGVLLTILLTALSVFFYFASRTFSEDKKLFVMELNMTLLRAATSEIKLELKTRVEQLQIFIPKAFNPLSDRPENRAALFDGLSSTFADELLRINFYRLRPDQKSFEPMREYKNTGLIEKRKYTDNFFKEINERFSINLQNYVGSQKIELLNRSVRTLGMKGSEEVGVLTFIIAGNLVGSDKKDILIVVDFMQDFLRKRLQQSEMAELFLITKKGSLLSHGMLKPTVEYASNPYPHPIVSRLQGKYFPRESLELDVNGEPYLCNINETGFNEVYAVSQIKKSEAFLAFYMLLQKSALLAALILCASVVFSILFASQLTQNIQRLKDAAEQIGTGNLKVSMNIETNDEIQSVADSFNFMVTRLKELLKETAQKARMEDELETARLVQETLLSSQPIMNDYTEVTPHYLPASECGGDFWDASLNGNTLTLVLGDATGHGAPAAIVTAVAKSCFSTLNRIYGGAALTPDQLLSTLNGIIYESCKGKLLMTMAIVQLNLETGEVIVCNAGHESPLCLRSSKAVDADPEKKKEKAEVLFARGERLGFTPDAQYEPQTFQLNIDDTILLYTDGISEARNSSGKEWGERALKKAFSASGTRPLVTIKNDLVAGMNQHTQGAKQEDDITFVLMRWKRAIIAKKAA